MNTDDIKLFYTLIRNIRSKRMNRKMIGYSIRENLLPVSMEDIEQFADATNDENIAGYRENKFAPPFFLSRLIIPLIKKILTHRDLKLNVMRLVHSRQDITWRRQIHAGDSLTAELTIADIGEIPAGELLSISIMARAGNLKIVEGMINILIRSSGKNKKKINKERENHKEIFRVTVRTQDGQHLKYARASGDNNFIHTSELIAKLAGLPRTIMHGACLMAMTCNALMNLLIKNDIKKLDTMSMRFAHPAIPGETLELVGYKGRDKNEVLFCLFNSSGKEVLKNGVFRFKK